MELADAIASKANPLTARVMVNRIWLHHFGAGLVGTPSDFGTRCEPPSHPELLDWLACRFMDESWSVKKLHRLIMLSAVYQQSSEVGQASNAQVRKVSASSAEIQAAAPMGGESLARKLSSEGTFALTPPARTKPLRRGEGPALSPRRGRTI